MKPYGPQAHAASQYALATPSRVAYLSASDVTSHSREIEVTEPLMRLGQAVSHWPLRLRKRQFPCLRHGGLRRYHTGQPWPPRFQGRRPDSDMVLLVIQIETHPRP
jgi:hypothetical protein